MELARESKFALDASTEVEVLAYTYSGTTTREVLCRVDLGDTDGPITGGGTYSLNIYIDDVRVAPSSDVTIPAGTTKAIFISRAILLEAGDQVSIRVTGQSGDAAVNSIASLRDATPVTKSEVQGSGSVVVDHDYGGTDALAVMTTEGARVDGVSIRAYREADYSAGNRGPSFVVAEILTNVDGRWIQPMMLESGSYILLLFKRGAIESKAVSLTVL